MKRNPEWKVFLWVHPQVTHSVVQDALKEIGNGGQADVLATFKSGNQKSYLVEWTPLKKILDDVDEVDLTPMIDVTFLLLIYFMVTTMIKQPEAELSIQLPGKASSSDVTPMEMLKVRIGDDGEVYMNGSLIEDGIDLEMPDLVGNLKTQKSMRDQRISGGARSKEEAEAQELKLPLQESPSISLQSVC